MVLIKQINRWVKLNSRHKEKMSKLKFAPRVEKERTYCKEIQPVYPKGNQSWVFIDVEAETPIFWPRDAKSWLIWKDLDVGKDWRQEEKGMTEEKMVGWHHWLNGHELQWTPGVGDGQGGQACCGSSGGKELDTTEWLNWTYREVIQQVDTHTSQYFQIQSLKEWR